MTPEFCNCDVVTAMFPSLEVTEPALTKRGAFRAMFPVDERTAVPVTPWTEDCGLRLLIDCPAFMTSEPALDMVPKLVMLFPALMRRFSPVDRFVNPGNPPVGSTVVMSAPGPL